MSMMRMVDGSGWSMKMVDGVRLMAMMVVIEMVIFYHGFSVSMVFFWLLNF